MLRRILNKKKNGWGENLLVFFNLLSVKELKLKKSCKEHFRKNWDLGKFSVQND